MPGKKTRYLATMGRNNRISVPAAIRRLLNLRRGDKIVFDIDNDDGSIRVYKAAVEDKSKVL